MQDEPNEQERREPIPAGGAWTHEQRQRARARRKAEQGWETGDEIVISLPDPERPGRPRKFRAKIIERLGKRSPDERDGAMLVPEEVRSAMQTINEFAQAADGDEAEYKRLQRKARKRGLHLQRYMRASPSDPPGGYVLHGGHTPWACGQVRLSLDEAEQQIDAAEREEER